MYFSKRYISKYFWCVSSLGFRRLLVAFVCFAAASRPKHVTTPVWEFVITAVRVQTQQKTDLLLWAFAWPGYDMWIVVSP